MHLPRNFTSRSFAVVGFSVALYAVVAVVFGWDEVRSHLAEFPRSLVIPLAGLTLVNYVLRYWRWEIYLRTLDVRLPAVASVKLYFATYVMVITPGKIGEVFKAGILRERFGVPLALGLPAVLAERIFDFLAVFLLAAAGVFFWPGPLTGLTTGLVLSAGLPLLLVLLRRPEVRRRLVDRAARAPMLARHRVGIDDSLAAFGLLTRPAVTAGTLTLSVLAWCAECVGLWLVCRGLGFPIAPPEAAFAYAAGTLVGSLTFLPGGLGGTEATIIWLLGTLGMPAHQGAAAALLIRLFTLWLAVLIGLGFFFAARELFTGDEDAATRP